MVGGVEMYSAGVATYYKNGDTTLTGTANDWNAKFDPTTSTLYIKNLSVTVFTGQEQASGELPALIAQRISQKDSEDVVLALPGYKAANYAQVTALAEAIVQGTAGKRIYVCLEEDMAKALGQAIALLRPGEGILCIDRVRLRDGDFLDIGSPIGPALPVVVKTLILEQETRCPSQ